MKSIVLTSSGALLLIMLAATTARLLATAAQGGETTVIADRTLVAWVSPANLTQRGGSVLTLERDGGVFDAIVFGEVAPGKWMAGSNSFARTEKDQQAPAETADAMTLVQIAIV